MLHNSCYASTTTRNINKSTERDLSKLTKHFPLYLMTPSRTWCPGHLTSDPGIHAPSVLVRCGPNISEFFWSGAVRCVEPTGSGAWIPALTIARKELELDSYIILVIAWVLKYSFSEHNFCSKVFILIYNLRVDLIDRMKRNISSFPWSILFLVRKLAFNQYFCHGALEWGGQCYDKLDRTQL